MIQSLIFNARFLEIPRIIHYFRGLFIVLAIKNDTSSFKDI